MPSSQRALRLYVHAIEIAMPIEVAAAMPPDVASGEVALCASAESSATGVTEVMHALERNCVPSAAKRSKVEKTSRSSDSACDDRPRPWTMWAEESDPSRLNVRR